MFNYLGKFRHLRAEEFIDLLDGNGLSEERTGHVARWSDCRTTLASITRLRGDISEAERMDAEAADAAVANADWLELRSSVRDRLLARSVKRFFGSAAMDRVDAQACGVLEPGSHDPCFRNDRGWIVALQDSTSDQSCD